jgi:hypothetical protein
VGMIRTDAGTEAGAGAVPGAGAGGGWRLGWGAVPEPVSVIGAVRGSGEAGWGRVVAVTCLVDAATCLDDAGCDPDVMGLGSAGDRGGEGSGGKA